MADDKQKAPQRSKAQLERDIAAARARLAGNIETLITEAHPKTVINRGVDEAKAFVVGEVKHTTTQTKAQFVTEEGEPRWGRIAVIGGAIAGAITFLMTIRAIVTKARKGKAKKKLQDMLDVDDIDFAKLDMKKLEQIIRRLQRA